MTQQDRQIKKVKLYRVLKVVFYSLGLPLFVVAVFLASVRFIGNDPFTGSTDLGYQLGFFHDINKIFTAPALYGLWIALGIWLLIAIVHIVLAKTVKNRRVRALSVTAFTLVVMMCALFGMDAAMSARVDSIYANAPAGVTAQDYKTLLSYYRTVSFAAHKKNLTESLIDQVKTLEKVYNVGWEGVNKTGVAGAISNKPLTYYNIIADDGTVGVDISFKTNPDTGFAALDYSQSGGGYEFKGDGKMTLSVEGKQVIRLQPNSKGQLIINGKTYSHYFAEERSSVTGGKIYTWYTRDMESTAWREGDDSSQITNRGEGVYGNGLYSQNGLMSDGWIFSLNNVLEILEDYYEAKEAIDNGNKAYYADAYASMYKEAFKRRDDYYNGRIEINGKKADEWLISLYNQEVYMTERFSLTRGELDELIAKVGALLGDNSLFDYLLTDIDQVIGDLGPGIDGIINNIPFLGGSLGKFLKRLNEGIGLSTFGLSSDTLATVANILGLITGKTYDYVDDLILTVSYKADDCYGINHDNLYVAIVRGVGEWQYAESGESVPVTRTKKENDKGELVWDGKWYYEDATEFTTTVTDGKTYDKNGVEVKFAVKPGSEPKDDIMIDIDFSDELIDEETGTYAFDFDTLSAFLNEALNNLLDNYNINLSEGTVGTILNLVKTLGILKEIDVNGEKFTGLVISGIEIPILNSQGRVELDINGILTNLLQNWYSYQSAVIKPVWEFYPNEDYANSVVTATKEKYKAQLNYAKYERALYTATVYGSMIGSTLIGDNLGTGAYPASLGLNSLAEVQELKIKLSYQPRFFPIMAARDMIALFAGIVIMFYFISFIAAQREEDYATGKMVAGSRKERKAAEKHEAEVIAEFEASEVEKAREGDSGDGAQFDDASDVDALRKESEAKGETPDIPVDKKSDEEVL